MVEAINASISIINQICTESLHSNFMVAYLAISQEQLYVHDNIQKRLFLPLFRKYGAKTVQRNY